VTGFAKTIHVSTRIEIHFIAYCNRYTHALSRHNNKTGIDNTAKKAMQDEKFGYCLTKAIRETRKVRHILTCRIFTVLRWYHLLECLDCGKPQDAVWSVWYCVIQPDIPSTCIIVVSGQWSDHAMSCLRMGRRMPKDVKDVFAKIIASHYPGTFLAA